MTTPRDGGGDNSGSKAKARGNGKADRGDVEDVQSRRRGGAVTRSGAGPTSTPRDKVKGGKEKRRRGICKRIARTTKTCRGR